MKQDKSIILTSAVNLEEIETFSFENDLKWKIVDKYIKEVSTHKLYSEPEAVKEKKPIGIETGMVYIAVPASIAMWIGIIYTIRYLVF